MDDDELMEDLAELIDELRDYEKRVSQGEPWIGEGVRTARTALESVYSRLDVAPYDAS